MRGLVSLLIFGSILVAVLALIGTTKPQEDDLARSIAQAVKATR